MSDAPNRPGTTYPDDGPMTAAMPVETARPPDPTMPRPVTAPAAVPSSAVTGTAPAVVQAATSAPATQTWTDPQTSPPSLGGLPGGTYPPARTAVGSGAVPAAGLGAVGALTLLIGAWAGIAVFVGPTFSWSPDGGTAWHWTLVRALLHAAPGAAGVLAGILMIGRTPRAARGLGRAEAAVAGLLAVVAGGWLVIGPSLWPVIRTSSGPLFASGSAAREFTYVVGTNLGPGFLLAVLGAVAIGWGAVRAPTR